MVHSLIGGDNRYSPPKIPEQRTSNQFYIIKKLDNSDTRGGEDRATKKHGAIVDGDIESCVKKRGCLAEGLRCTITYFAPEYCNEEML